MWETDPRRVRHPVATVGKQRLTHIDWMRGLACLLMFQTHCYDSWLDPASRQSGFFRWSQLVGTLPAPLFLFLAGVAVALVVDRKLKRGLPPGQIARETMRRGAEILGLGLLFRGQEWLLGQPAAPWTDLLRVDILNEIGVSIALLGLVFWLAKTRGKTVVFAGVGAAVISLLTPLLWTTWEPGWLPWFLESYVNGVHTFGEPQAWLFPIFPWAAFAFAGLAFGMALDTRTAREHPDRTHVMFGMAGAGLLGLALWLDSLQAMPYPVYDFWHTSPFFFLARVGVLLMILFASYAWCRWGLGEWKFSPLVQLGTTSLIVYWVHIEFVYGRFSILAKRGSSIADASLGLASIFLAMVLLSIARTRLRGRGAEALGWLKRMAEEARAASE
jgi:uncharacterized membrane protein